MKLKHTEATVWSVVRAQNKQFYVHSEFVCRKMFVLCLIWCFSSVLVGFIYFYYFSTFDTKVSVNNFMFEIYTLRTINISEMWINRFSRYLVTFFLHQYLFYYGNIDKHDYWTIYTIYDDLLYSGNELLPKRARGGGEREGIDTYLLITKGIWGDLPLSWGYLPRRPGVGFLLIGASCSIGLGYGEI